VKPIGGGALAQPAEHACAMVRVIGRSPGIVVHQSVFEGAIDEDGQLAGRGRDGPCLADAVGEVPIKGAEGRLGAAQAHRGEAQDRSGRVGRGLRPGAEQATAKDLVLGGKGEPRGEMFRCQRLMSMPISASRRRALYGPMASSCVRSMPMS